MPHEFEIHLFFANSTDLRACDPQALEYVVANVNRATYNNTQALESVVANVNRATYNIISIDH